MMESEPQSKSTLEKPPGYRASNLRKPPLPPRKAVLPPSFRPKPKRRKCCRVFCCTCCIIILVLILVIMIAAALFYLIYEPALPDFHLDSFGVPKLNVTTGNDGSFLDADTAARVEVKNRSGKMTWHFADIKLYVSADNGNLNLGSSEVAKFSLKEKDVASVKVETSVRNEELDEKQRRKLKSSVTSKALVPSVEVGTKISVGVQGWKSPSISVTVECGGVTMRQLDQGDSPLCSITLLKWIKLR